MLFRLTLSIFICVTLAVTLLAGCWNRREIETLGFVTAVGADQVKEENKVRLTVHIAKPFAIGGGGEGKPAGEKPFWIVSSTGDTVFEAVREFAWKSPRRLYWAHNRFLLIGEDFARDGIKELADWFSRDHESRRLIRIIVARGTTAWDLLQAEFELEPMPAEGGLGITLNNHISLSAIPWVNLHEFLLSLESEGIEPVAIGAEVIPMKPQYNIEGELERKEIKAAAGVRGTAVFKGTVLVGWLNETETRGFNWIVGKVKSGILVVKQPGSEKNLASLEILSGKSKIKPQVQNDKVCIKIEIEAQANLGELQGRGDPMQHVDIWNILEQEMAEAIKSEVIAALSKAKELNSDIFGFGREIYRTSPKKWAQLRDRWDEVFPHLDVQIKVKAKLRRAGLSIRSPMNY